jgi:hypothetical protein
LPARRSKPLTVWIKSRFFVAEESTSSARHFFSIAMFDLVEGRSLTKSVKVTGKDLDVDGASLLL